MPALTSNVFLLDEGQPYGGHGTWYGPDYPANEVTEDIAARIDAEAPYAAPTTGSQDLRTRLDDGLTGVGEPAPTAVSIRLEVDCPSVAWSMPDLHLSFPADHSDGTSATVTSSPTLLTAPFTGSTGFGVKFGGYGGDSVPVDTQVAVTLVLVDADGATYGQFSWSSAIPAGTDPAAATGLSLFFVPFTEDSSNAVFDLSADAEGTLFVHPPTAGPWTATLTVFAYPA